MYFKTEQRVDIKGRKYWFIRNQDPSPVDTFMSATVFPHPIAGGYAIYIWWRKPVFDLEFSEPIKYKRWVNRYLVVEDKEGRLIPVGKFVPYKVIDSVLSSVSIEDYNHERLKSWSFEPMVEEGRRNFVFDEEPF